MLLLLVGGHAKRGVRVRATDWLALAGGNACDYTRGGNGSVCVLDGIRESRCTMERVQTVLVDDLDGSEAHETVEFGVAGEEFAIDLSADNAAALRRILAGYIAVARREPRSVRAKTTPRFRQRTGHTNMIRSAAHRARGRAAEDRSAESPSAIMDSDAAETLSAGETNVVKPSAARFGPSGAFLPEFSAQ